VRVVINFFLILKCPLTKIIIFSAGSATLSMAFAGARFANSLLEAVVLKKAGVTECTYIQCDVVPGLSFFSTIVEFGVKPFFFFFL
jgi:malate/lactate dehydrogenase